VRYRGEASMTTDASITGNATIDRFMRSLLGQAAGEQLLHMGDEVI
jgi:uncharacterized protein YfiM (DUF2279 family)